MLLTLAMLACDSSSTDEVKDGGIDNDSGSGAELWEWCPSSDTALVDDSWSDTLAVLDVLYCTSPKEGVPLTTAMANKRRHRFVPGNYPLSSRDGRKWHISNTLLHRDQRR